MNLIENELGFEIDTPFALVFFGKKNSQLENLKKHYPQFQWSRVKQTHSSIVVPVTRSNAVEVGVTEADAQWTADAGLALPISTADCVPVMIADPHARRIAGIHAGWRGVENRIIPRTIEALNKAGSRAEDLWFFIGPHIQQNSFEVDADVRDMLLGCSPGNDDSLVQTRGPKFLVDLNAIVKNQLAEFQVAPDQLFDLHIDTFKDQRLHSHRRDKTLAGRQLSYVAMKTS